MQVLPASFLTISSYSTTNCVGLPVNVSCLEAHGMAQHHIYMLQQQNFTVVFHYQLLAMPACELMQHHPQALLGQSYDDKQSQT